MLHALQSMLIRYKKMIKEYIKNSSLLSAYMHNKYAVEVNQFLQMYDN